VIFDICLDLFGEVLREVYADLKFFQFLGNPGLVLKDLPSGEVSMFKV